MSTLTRKDVTAMLGELDDDVVAEILAIGATPEELAEAHAWLTNDEPLMNAGRSLGRHRRRHYRRGRGGRRRKAELNGEAPRRCRAVEARAKT
jgi:hypothetical protein